MKLQNFKMSKYVLVITILAVFGVYCSPAIITPMEQDLVKGREKFGESLTLADLNKGYEVMTGKCVSCHRLYKPSQFSVTEWNKIIPWMAPKAALSQDEQGALYKYVISKRLSPKTETPKKG